MGPNSVLRLLVAGSCFHILHNDEIRPTSNAGRRGANAAKFVRRVGYFSGDDESGLMLRKLTGVKVGSTRTIPFV